MNILFVTYGTLTTLNKEGNFDGVGRCAGGTRVPHMDLDLYVHYYAAECVLTQHHSSWCNILCADSLVWPYFQLLFLLGRWVMSDFSLSSTISRSLLKLTSIESMVLYNHLFLCRPPLLLPSVFPESGSLPTNRLFASGGQSIGTSASASVIPMNIQGWFPLGLTGFISLMSKA